MTIDPLNVDVEDTIFVNIKAYRIIVLTCDDITDMPLVVSTVTLDGAFGGTHGLIDSSRRTSAPSASRRATSAFRARRSATCRTPPTSSAIVPKAS